MIVTSLLALSAPIPSSTLHKHVCLDVINSCCQCLLPIYFGANNISYHQLYSVWFMGFLTTDKNNSSCLRHRPHRGRGTNFRWCIRVLRDLYANHKLRFMQMRPLNDVKTHFATLFIRLSDMYDVAFLDLFSYWICHVNIKLTTFNWCAHTKWMLDSCNTRCVNQAYAARRSNRHMNIANSRVIRVIPLIYEAYDICSI